MSFSKKLMIGAVTAFLGFAASGFNSTDYFNVHKDYANRGNTDAQFNAGYCLNVGDGTAKNAGQSLAYLRRAANAGNVDAQFYLGLDFEAKKNLRQALVWYKKAAAKYHPAALYKLSEFYEFGKGGEKVNWEKSAEYCKKSAEAGFVHAQYKYGVLCAMGKGVPQSWKEAVVWYTKAAQTGKKLSYQPHAMAQYNLAWCYANGQGVAQSWKEAVKWYREAAENGIVEAQFQLAECYARGEGVETNNDWAVYWYRKAAANGVEKAKAALNAYGLN